LPFSDMAYYNPRPAHAAAAPNDPNFLWQVFQRWVSWQLKTC